MGNKYYSQVWKKKKCGMLTAVPVLNSAPCHEDIWGGRYAGVISP
jgi:hypothetical protein